MARVTVIIPTYDYARFLGECIQSVLDQTFQDFEIIVVDDGSSDNTREVVSSFKDTRIRYIYQDHCGVSAAQNTALRVASGEYITGLSGDDVYLPQNLEAKIKLLDSRPDIGLVCSDAYIFNDNTGAIIGRLWRDPKGFHPGFDPAKAAREPLKSFIQWGFFIMLQAAMTRRQVFDIVGYFDETIPTHEDWDLVLRIVRRFPIEIIDMPLVKLRRHSANLSINQEKMYSGAMAVVNKLIRSSSFSKEELKLLKDSMIRQHFRFGRWALLNGREAAARKALIAGIRLAPWNINLYIYYLFSVLGTRKVLALRNLRKNMGHHSVSREQSADTKSIIS
jgi:glycosyltransferase involved in cell wall biosynthesis